MTTIAHLTDLHLVEADYAARPTGARARLSYLSFGRPLDPMGRRERVERALAEVKRANVDHVLITGDVTEDGHDEQFEILGELLIDSGLSPERVTLVPGNHDAYADGGSWQRAMQGPLGRFAATSTPGTPVELRDVTIVPVSTSFHQSCLRSAGAIAQAELEQLGRIARDSGLRR